MDDVTCPYGHFWRNISKNLLKRKQITKMGFVKMLLFAFNYYFVFLAKIYQMREDFSIFVYLEF